MSETQPHEMQLVQTHSSGAEEWHCPTCGRRFLMHWPPSYKKIVLEPGDEYAAHVGGKGGVRMSGELSQQPHEHAPGEGDPAADLLLAHHTSAGADERPLPVEELGAVPVTDELLPWLRWMHKAGLADSLEA